jgi:hypothetical protein
MVSAGTVCSGSSRRRANSGRSAKTAPIALDARPIALVSSHSEIPNSATTAAASPKLTQSDRAAHGDGHQRVDVDDAVADTRDRLGGDFREADGDRAERDPAEVVPVSTDVVEEGDDEKHARRGHGRGRAA